MKKLNIESMVNIEGGGLLDPCGGFGAGFFAGLGFGLTLSGAGAPVGLALCAVAVGLDYYCQGRAGA